MSWYDPTSWDVGDAVAALTAPVTGGLSLWAKSEYDKLTAPPELTNARGDTLSDSDKITLGRMTPQQRSAATLNWLSAGGPPKPIDPSQIFAEDRVLAPVLRRSAAGQGINGLFGVGNLIGEIQPLQPIKPLNLSPLQPGVPYSALPVPGGR